MTSRGAAGRRARGVRIVRRRVVLPASGVRVARPAAPLQVQVTAVRTSCRRAFQFQLRVTRWPPDQFETQAVTGICQGWGGNRCERCGPGYSWWPGLGTCDEECWTGTGVRFLVSPIPAADRVRPGTTGPARLTGFSGPQPAISANLLPYCPALFFSTHVQTGRQAASVATMATTWRGDSFCGIDGGWCGIGTA